MTSKYFMMRKWKTKKIIFNHYNFGGKAIFLISLRLSSDFEGCKHLISKYMLDLNYWSPKFTTFRKLQLFKIFQI